MTESTNTQQCDPIELIEVHNVYTLYELDEDGEQVAQPLLSFSRPQDWGDRSQWYYHTCDISFESNGRRYLNHCHLWQGSKRSPVEAFQIIAPHLFMVLMPGRPPELCGRSHLAPDDFWLNEWGEMPDYFGLDEFNY